MRTIYRNLMSSKINSCPNNSTLQNNIGIATTITDDMILSNPIYSQFNIIPTKKKKNVTLLLIVSSGPKRFERRQAIRDTYWKQCHSSKEVSSYITE